MRATGGEERWVTQELRLTVGGREQGDEGERWRVHDALGKPQS